MAGRQGIYPRPVRVVVIPIGPSIAYVPLTRGQFALIDSVDAPLIGQWNWYARWAKESNGFYAVRMDRSSGHSRTLKMHRVLLPPPAGKLVDHKNGNTLDNRSCANLREATTRQNAQNMRKHKANTSGYKGVSWDAKGGQYVSQIRHEGKSVKLWRGKDPAAGHAIYCEAAIRLYGEFARTA